MKRNKKGFALIEILSVTVVVMVIFALLYANFLPLMSEYEKRIAYTDVETQYISFYMRKLYKDVIKNDVDLGNSHYKILYSNNIKCDLLTEDDKTTCQNIASAADMKMMILTTKNTEILKTKLAGDASLDPISEYIKFLPKYVSTNDEEIAEPYRLIIKTGQGYSTTELKVKNNAPEIDDTVDTTTTGLSTSKFIEVMENYKTDILKGYTLTNTNIASDAIFNIDISGARDKSVMLWLVPNSSDTSKYDMYIGADDKNIALGNDASSMFKGFINMTSIDLSNIDTSNVTNMSSMFYQCKSLTQLDLSKFDTRNVISVESMFQDTTALENIYVSNTYWDISKANISLMFEGSGTSSVTSR